MSLIDMTQIDWSDDSDDLNDSTHRHMPEYSIYPQFHNDTPLPYFGNCPICKDIALRNKEFYEDKHGVKISYRV